MVPATAGRSSDRFSSIPEQHMESVTFVLCLLVLGAHALLVFGGVSTHASEGCTIDGHELKAGEKYTPIGECVERTCVGNGAVSGIWCSKTFHNKPCKEVKEDLSKPYPACCSYYEDC